MVNIKERLEERVGELETQEENLEEAIRNITEILEEVRAEKGRALSTLEHLESDGA